MMSTRSDIMDRAGLERWLRESTEDNNQRRERLRRNLRRALDNELTPRQRQVVTMYYMKGYTMAAIAAELGVGRPSICRTLHRAREKIRHILEYSL